jgi:hypothetical protein
MYSLWSVCTNHDFRCHDSRIQHWAKNRISPIFCALLDAAVASDTENHIHVNRPLTVLSSIKTLHVTMVHDEK